MRFDRRDWALPALLPFLFMAAASCAGPMRSTAREGDAPYGELGPTHRAMGTDSAQAQRCFDQALVLLWAFNHDEAIEAFREAARLDPSAPMPWWGIAMACGPHINNPVVPPERARMAIDALAEAQLRSARASALEKELIAAQLLRFGSDPNADRASLDQAYADAMRQVHRHHPDDADVATWTAEALMDLHPWDLWTASAEAKPHTPEILTLLEHALSLDARHPGACHLYIHAQEAGPTPERALPAANHLRTAVPDAGHLVHMPAHIDARLGAWHAASEANRSAIQADQRRAARFPRDGFYRVYMAHNHHFLAWSSMMLGDSKSALEAARAMVAGVPAAFVESKAMLVDGYLPVVLHVQLRFGLWDDILAAPEFAPDLKISNAVRRYARGVALTALRRFDEAEEELRQFDEIASTIEAERPLGNNMANTVMHIPRALLAGELEFARGERDIGLDLMRQAVRLQDQLVYDEAPDWMMPSRHALGAALLEANGFAEAQAVFEADLRMYPNNGWALFGLQRALAGQAKAAEAADADARFRDAWRHADVTLKSPCFCQAGS